MNNISNNISNNGCFGFKMEQFESLGVHVEWARVSHGRDQMNILSWRVKTTRVVSHSFKSFYSYSYAVQLKLFYTYNEPLVKESKPKKYWSWNKN